MRKSAFAFLHFALACFILHTSGEVSYQANNKEGKREYKLSEGLGGSCRIVVSNRCCTQERVVKQLQKVQCECNFGYSAGTTRTKPACVSDDIKKAKRWCDMDPCQTDETCNPLVAANGLVQGWQCRKGDQIKTIKVTE